MRRAAILMSMMTILASCAGEATVGRGGSGLLDGHTPALDAGQLDGGGPGGLSADTRLPAEASTAPPAPTAAADCSKWSAWTCQEIPVVLCKATCAASTVTYSLSCLKKGGCACGTSTGLCGPYSYSQPCDACRQAFENGCCVK